MRTIVCVHLLSLGPNGKATLNNGNNRLTLDAPVIIEWGSDLHDYHIGPESPDVRALIQLQGRVVKSKILFYVWRRLCKCVSTFP